MLTLYHFGPAWGVEDPSPFCLKVLTFLRLSGLSFRSETGVGYLRKAPRRKLPYIDDGGRVVSDSAHIIGYLKSQYGCKLEPNSTDRERAALHGLCRMLDEDLFWQIVYFRWIDRDNWTRITKPTWFGDMPWPKRVIMSNGLQWQVKKTLYRQGIGRHNKDEVAELGMRNIQAIADYLGDREFIAGSEPCDADATVYGFLENVAVPPHRSPLKELLLSQPNLVRYLDRMRGHGQ